MPAATLRQAIWDALVALTPGAPAYAQRVYWPGSVETQDAKPFLVLVLGPEDPGVVWGGTSQMVYISINAGKGDADTLDAVEADVRARLDQKPIDTTTERYTLLYDGVAGQDVPDDEWGTLTRMLRFVAAPTDNAVDTSIPLPDLNAFTTWAIPEVQTDPKTSVPSDASPLVYWRRGPLRRVSREHVGANVVDVEYDFRAHVVAPSKAKRIEYTRRLVESLMTLDRHYLALSDGTSLRFTNIAADSEIDPKRDGQVSLSGWVEYAISEGILPPNINVTKLADEWTELAIH